LRSVRRQRLANRKYSSESEVTDAMKRLARNLDNNDIPYCFVGGLALSAHGFKRFTHDVDVLMTKVGLKSFQDNLLGRGYVRRFPNATKSFVDTQGLIPVDVLVSGEFPGDGKPKEVVFPDPTKAVSFEAFDKDQKIKYIDLVNLINLKLASATSKHRYLKDAGDVQQLIKCTSLDQSFAEKLAPSVRSMYLDLWKLAQEDL